MDFNVYRSEEVLQPSKRSVENENVQPVAGFVQQKISSGILYLKGLNGIRAIAAIAVLLTHILAVYKIKKLLLGGFGVSIFFSLSGFLITLLLLKEVEKTKSISIKKFYARRILRIWPLYFFYLSITLLVNYFVFSNYTRFPEILYFILFLPNIPFVKLDFVYMLEHYWSLGVEEQFYFFWPYLFKIFFKKFVLFCLSFICLFLTIKVFISRYYGINSLPYSLIYYCRFDCMAIGGLASYWFYKKPACIAFLNHLSFQLFAWFVLALAFLNRFHIARIFDQEIIAFVTVILIINQITNIKSIINFENKPLNYLGKISYGIYVYHPLVIGLLLLLYKHYAISIKGLGYITFPVETIVITIFLAHFSYHLFESRFLRFKQKFAVVKTTNSAI